jgi:hypothetical protein
MTGLRLREAGDAVEDLIVQLRRKVRDSVTGLHKISEEVCKANLS